MALPFLAISVLNAARGALAATRSLRIASRAMNVLGSDGGQSALRGATLNIKVEHNFGEVAKAFGRLQQDLQRQALPRAMQRMLELARTEARRQISAAYNLPAATIRQRLKITRARPGPHGLTAELYVADRAGRAGRSLNVVRFLVGRPASAKGAKTTKAKARRVLKAGAKAKLKVQIKRGSIKPSQRGFLGNAGRTVFQRKGKDRYPIEAVQTIDVGQMFNTRRVLDQVVAFIEQRWLEVLEREVGYVMNRFKRYAPR